MRYDRAHPIAVFLGPSLRRDRATAQLAANYYPPARMGDVYRLIGSGVRTIVLIDGLFHGAAAVWHRELLEALGHGMDVFGAASMGALRAAELHTYGMTGVGTVFEWLRDGVIDGDDEVALLHADADAGFRVLSEPLVNVRYRAQQGYDQGQISRAQCDALVALAKAMPFMERTQRRLLESDLVRAWAPETQAQLRMMFASPSGDVKALDAQRALAQAAVRGCSASATHDASRFYRAVSQRHRGALAPDGSLVAGDVLWTRLRSQPNAFAEYLTDAAKVFYFGLLADDWAIECPAEHVRRYGNSWREQVVTGDFDGWLRANGLTTKEFDSCMAARARIDWMLGHACNRLDDTANADRLPDLARSLGLGTLARLSAMELVLLAEWAKRRGLECPASEIDRLSQGQWAGEARPLLEVLACARWLIERQPYAFGYTGWAPVAAVLAEVRLRGQVPSLLADEEAVGR